MKNVSRREFLGTAIGTGLVGSATLAGIPMLPREARELLQSNEKKQSPNTNPSANHEQKLSYDVIPPYLHWRFGNEYRGNILSAKSTDFELWFTPSAERKNYDFRTEVRNKCKEIDQKRNGKPIALCYSGGENSEIIAITLKEMGIPFDLYFLDVWHSDVARKTLAEPFAKKIGAPLRVVGLLEENFITEHLVKTSKEYGSDNLNFSLMTYLFNAIPDTHFIVTGSGHLERSGPAMEKIGEKNHIPNGTDSYYRPFSMNHVLFYTWAEKNKRVGEFYFFQSSPELLISVFQNPVVYSQYPIYSQKALIYSSFPEISPRAKTTNWDGPVGETIAKSARTKIQKYMETFGFDSYWQPNVGCAVNLAGIFKA
jgi:hypothetical protein